MTVKIRRRIVQASLLVVLALVVFFLMLFGMQHTILVDNKSYEADGKIYEPIDGMRVYVDGKDVGEFYSGDRDKAIVSGPTHTIKIEILDDNKVIEKTFTVPQKKMFLLSVPALVAGSEKYLSEFIIANQPNAVPEKEEAPVLDPILLLDDPMLNQTTPEGVIEPVKP